MTDLEPKEEQNPFKLAAMLMRIQLDHQAKQNPDALGLYNRDHQFILLDPTREYVLQQPYGYLVVALHELRHHTQPEASEKECWDYAYDWMKSHTDLIPTPKPENKIENSKKVVTS